MSRRLHIAYVCGDRGVPIGGHKGASAHIGELTRALAERRTDIRIVAARVHDGVEEGALPAPTVDLGSQRSVRQMRQLLFADADGKKEQTEAGEAFGLLLNQPITKALERLHKEWRIDAVYERYSLWSYAAASFARANDIPYLIEVNAPLPEEQRRYRSLANAAAASSIESFVLRSADRVLVPSAALRPYVLEKGARAAYVLPNAADPDRFRPEGGRVHERSSDGGPFVVGFAGSLKPWHGLDYLVRAFCRLHRRSSDYRLLIVGDGPLRAGLERTIGRNGLRAAATFTGAIDIEQVASLLTRMDAGVAPYPPLRDFYFSPIKIFEYMAAGVPIVASDIGQIGEILEDRRTALLCRPGSVVELADRIEELRRRPDLAARLARQARALLLRRYTWSRNAGRVLAMIDALKKKKRAAR
jgi:glycosyltransferase involved in cell wall biosynthesis